MTENYKSFSKPKNMIKKAGRTIIIRKLDSEELMLNDLVGVVQINDLQNGKVFAVFDTIDNSKNAFKLLRTNNKLSVRYAYYKIFFTMEGLTDTTDYAQIKTKHSEWINKNSDGIVLYYKQYMKESQYLGCGDFTVDTKDSMDKLLDKDVIKNYNIENFTGTFYRFNKKTPTKENVNYE